MWQSILQWLVQHELRLHHYQQHITIIVYHWLHSTFLVLVLHYTTTYSHVHVCVYTQISSQCGLNHSDFDNFCVSQLANQYIPHTPCVCIYVVKISYPQDHKIKYISVWQLKWMTKILLRIIFWNWICTMAMHTRTHSLTHVEEDGLKVKQDRYFRHGLPLSFILKTYWIGIHPFTILFEKFSCISYAIWSNHISFQYLTIESETSL